MENVVLVIHALAGLVIIVLILFQQGKGAAAGASFGAGASQTVFGSEGGGSFFTRATAFFAAVFFCTSLGLAVIAKNNSTLSHKDIPVPAAATAPAVQSDVPTVQPQSAAPASDIPVAPAQ